MLIKAKTLKGYKLHSLDGEIGKVKDLLFDDDYWTVRYLVAETGNWLTGRKVLISPHALKTADKEKQTVAVDLTKKQVEDSPPLTNETPVSRKYEEEYHEYYGWPNYWGGPYMWGNYPYVGFSTAARLPEIKERPVKEDISLRSTNEIVNYKIHSKNGEIGHVNDFIIDDKTWEISYLIVDTKNWWPGKKVLVSTRRIEKISWIKSEVFVNLFLETIKQAPEYTDGTFLTSEFETEVSEYYKLNA